MPTTPSHQVYLISDPVLSGDMTTQMAQVVSYDAQQVHLMVPLQSHCQSCHQGGCGAAWLARLWPRRTEVLKIARYRVPFPVQVGDQVTLTVHQATLDRAVWHLYGWPLGGLLSGIVIGAGLGGEPMSVLLGLVGLGAGLCYVRARLHHKRLEHVSVSVKS